MLNVYALCGGLIDLDLSGFFCDVAPGRRMTVPCVQGIHVPRAETGHSRHNRDGNQGEGQMATRTAR